MGEIIHAFNKLSKWTRPLDQNLLQVQHYCCRLKTLFGELDLLSFFNKKGGSKWALLLNPKQELDQADFLFTQLKSNKTPLQIPDPKAKKKKKKKNRLQLFCQLSIAFFIRFY